MVIIANVKGENLHGRNVEAESNGHINHDTPLDILETMMRLGVEIQVYRVDNERLIKT
jgi:hypothetical protein